MDVTAGPTKMDRASRSSVAKDIVKNVKMIKLKKMLNKMKSIPRNT
jgi:hypothetical protein